MDDDVLRDPAPSTPISPTCTSPTNADLMDSYLPKVIPNCVTLTITKLSILQAAVEKLGVKLHQIRIVPMDDDNLLGSVSMDVPPHREYPLTSKQEFFGMYTPWREEAVESACSVALAYLKKVGVLTVDDCNYADLTRSQAKLREALFWEDAFHSRLLALQDNSAEPPMKSDVTAINPTKRKLVLDGHRKLTQAAHCVLTGSCSTDQTSYVLPAEITPPSIDSQPNLRAKGISSASGVCRALFQGPENRDQTGQAFLVDSDETSDLSTDGVSVTVPKIAMPPVMYQDKRHKAKMLKGGNNDLTMADKA